MSPSLSKRPDRPPNWEPGPVTKGCAYLFGFLLVPVMLDLMITGGAFTSALISLTLGWALGTPYGF